MPARTYILAHRLSGHTGSPLPADSFTKFKFTTIVRTSHDLSLHQVSADLLDLIRIFHTLRLENNLNYRIISLFAQNKADKHPLRAQIVADTKTFQGLILTLQNYWAEQGCVIQQPLDLEVGAGTFHPATFLRAIGPEPWSAAYVQPCRRPTDGRYGENPNRLQHYYQYQVVIKPSPLDIQEMYLAR